MGTTRPLPTQTASVAPKEHLQYTYEILIPIIILVIVCVVVVVILIFKRRQRYALLNGHNGEELEMDEPVLRGGNEQESEL